MSGRTISYDEKQRIVDEYVKKVKLYEEHEPLKFDLRSYDCYLEQHSIPRDIVPEEIMNMFILS